MRTARLNVSVLCPVCLLFAWAASPRLATSQVVDVYVSSKGGDRLTKGPRLHFEAAGTSAADFAIDESVQYQKIIGFGASFLEAGLITLNSLPRERQEEVLRSLFDADTGAGLSAMKTVVGATDFMSAGPFYSYDDVPGDVELKHFSIQRDLGRNGLVTYIRRAQHYGSFVLQAPMDYPPDWMLIDAEKNPDVNPRYYDALARYYLRYVQEYEKQGIEVDYLSLFNEPRGYTRISYAEIRVLLKNHVGPLFAKAGVKTRLQVSDAPTRSEARRELPTILDDPEALRYVSTISYHGYDFMFRKRPWDPEPESSGTPQTTESEELDMVTEQPSAATGYHFAEFANVAELHAKYPSLPLWMTEVCYFKDSPSVRTWPRHVPVYGFEDGDFWGQQIAADMEAGASGWTYWNMILDETGGPALVSVQHGDPAYNVQHPVVVINRRTHTVTYTGLYYYLAHFSKFVRPGSYRIKVNGSRDSIKVLAFKRPDGAIALETINSREENTKTTVKWRNHTLALELPAKSIATYVWNREDE